MSMTCTCNLLIGGVNLLQIYSNGSENPCEHLHRKGVDNVAQDTVRRE